MSLPTQTVRFGSFQLDLRAAELQHNGSKIKLPEQPNSGSVTTLRAPEMIMVR